MKLRLYYNICYLLIICLMFPISGYAQNIFSLDDCIKLALENSSQYKIAQSREKMAESQVLSAYSNFLPQLHLSGGGSQQHLGALTREYNTAVYKYDENNIPVLDADGKPVVERYVKTLNETEPQVRNNFDVGFSYNQLLYDGGQWWNRIKTQNSYRGARTHDTEAARQNTIALVKQYYYELLKAQNQIIVLEEAVMLAKEQLKRSQSRYEIGYVAEIDVLRSQVNLNEQKIVLISQQKEVELAQSNLNAVMGRRIDEPIVILEDSSIGVLDASLKDILKIAELNNPNIKAAQEEHQTAQYSYKVAKGALLPTIRANFNYSRFNPNVERIYRDINQNYQWSYRLSVSLPIFDGLRTKSNIDYEYSNIKIAEEYLVDAKREVFKYAKKYYMELVNNLDKIKMLKENLTVAEKNVQLAQERYNVGSGTLLETIDAQVSFTRSRIQLVRAIYDAKIARAQLEGVIGVEELNTLKL